MIQQAVTPGRAWPEARTVPPGAATRCGACPLRGAELCRAICEEGAPRARPPPLRRYGRGKLILEKGAPLGLIGVIRRGYARRSEMRVNGKRVLFGLAVPGDIVGGLSGQCAPCDLEAATDVEICLYDNTALRRHLADNRRLRRLLLREIDEQHHGFLGSVWRYGTLDSRERIIAFLVWATGVMPTERQPDGALDLTMEIERRDWADLTNTAVETISRTLRHLEEKALVTCLSPYRFRLHDPDRLACMACVDLPAPQAFGDGTKRCGAPAGTHRGVKLTATPRPEQERAASRVSPPGQRGDVNEAGPRDGPSGIRH